MRVRSVIGGCLLAAGFGLALMPAHAADPVPWRGKVTAFAAENFRQPAWGFSHSQRDYALARKLAAADHVTLDDDVLFAASYLHDMAAFAQWREAGKEHGDVAAMKIDTVLADTDFPMTKINAVRDAIRAHMFYRDAASPEARYLHDADALDWLGAIGVTREIALVDPKGGKPLGPDAIKAIEDNLAAVPSRVFSPAGKAEIAPRIAEEKTFLDALRRETENLSTL
jgi:HD superfamily phosphodiesterase